MVIIFPKMAWTPPKWPSQISFLSPNMLVNLCIKQLLPPAYSRLLWVCAPSNPSPGRWSGPLFHPTGWIPPHLSTQFPCCHPLPANVKGPGIEKQNPSRRVRRLSPSRRFKPQGLGVVPKWDLSPQSDEFPGQSTKCSHTFQKTNSLRRTMHIVECSLLHWRAQGRVSS